MSRARYCFLNIPEGGASFLRRLFLMNFPSCYFRSVAALALSLGLGTFNLAAADSDPAPAGGVEATNAQEVIRSYLQLQEQLHLTQLAVEQNRKEARDATAQAAEALANRLQGIEQALASQRARELDSMQSTNRVMLIVAGSFATLGFLAMLLMAYFQWRTVNGLAELAASVPASRALGAGPALAALGPGDAHLMSSGPAEQSNLRLLGAMEPDSGARLGVNQWKR